MLPDQITGPLVFLGLLVNTQSVFAPSPASAVWGAVAGYGALWVVRTAYRALTGNPEAVGLGGCKLLAMLGAWTGCELLGQTVAIGRGLCIIYQILHRSAGRRRGETPFPLVTALLDRVFPLSPPSLVFPFSLDPLGPFDPDGRRGLH